MHCVIHSVIPMGDGSLVVVNVVDVDVAREPALILQSGLQYFYPKPNAIK